MQYITTRKCAVYLHKYYCLNLLNKLLLTNIDTNICFNDVP